MLTNSINTRSIILTMHGYNSGWYLTSYPMLHSSYTIPYLFATKLTFFNCSILLLKLPIVCLPNCLLCFSSGPLKHNKTLRVICTYPFRISCIPMGKQWLYTKVSKTQQTSLVDDEKKNPVYFQLQQSKHPSLSHSHSHTQTHIMHSTELIQ